MKTVTGFCLTALLAILTGLFASPATADEAFEVKSMEEFLEYQYSLREAVESGEGRFSELSGTDRTRLIRAQDEIFRILANKSSVKRLGERDRRDLYNAQHVVAAIVTRNRGDRSICQFESELGSRLQTINCRTVAEAEEMRRDNSRKYGQLQRCKGSECSR